MIRKIFILATLIVAALTNDINHHDKACKLEALDLVFVMDQSGSIGLANYQTALNELGKLVNDSLVVGKSDTNSHVGMVLFDTEGYVRFNLEAYNNNKDVVNAIKGSPYSGGGTSIYNGLLTATTDVFGAAGDRPSVPNLLLIITDGQDGNIEQIRQLNMDASSKGITIYAIGVGKNVNFNELTAAAGNSSRVYNATDYQSLEKILNTFCSSVQNGGIPTNSGTVDRTCSSNIQNLWVDMVFVVDSSKGVDNLGLRGIAGAIDGFVSTGFQIGRTNGRYSRAGIVDMGASATVVADLHKYYNSSQLIADLLTIPYKADEKPDIYSGLKKASDILDGATGNPNRKQVIYLFSSENDIECDTNVRSSTDQDPCRLAATIKEKGITIVTFALRYDGRKDTTLMKEIGSPCFNFFNDQTIISDMITSALYVNCFCQRPLTQFKNDAICLKTAECVYVHETPSTWSTAQLICPLDGTNSTLVNIFTEEKNKFLLDQLKTYNSFPYIIGLQGNKTGFSWDSHHELGTYKNWASSEPNFANGDCVNFNDKGQWYMIGCNDYTHASNYICEEPACDADNYCS
uniref:VWFA domain-containing protein n=1 Tax=Parastrongyloides trichosuri TaxID=131310 RepID=A0A0N4ZBI4_PARTI